MADLSKIRLNGTNYNLKDAEAREELSKKIPIVEYGEPITVVDTTTVSFSKDGNNDWYISAENPINGFTNTSFIHDNIYLIEWDGVEYKAYYREAYKVKSTGVGWYDWGYIGNIFNLGWGPISNDETLIPFCIEYSFKNNADEVQIISYDTATTHTIRITRIPFIKTLVERTLYEEDWNGVPLIRKGTSSGSVLIGYSPKIASASCAIAEGIATTASGRGSHAEGLLTTASGEGSHAKGALTTASGKYSHAEGIMTTASGSASHAEGSTTVASEWGSHAEGSITTASGMYAHTEGQRTTASGNMSHAEGNSTIANHLVQHVFGQYNIADPSEAAANKAGTYIEIVGNGTADDARFNARTLDWSGNETLAGKLTVGAAPTANMDVATKQYVDNAIPTVPTNVSNFTNDSGYLTLATLPIYDGTVQNG